MHPLCNKTTFFYNNSQMNNSESNEKYTMKKMLLMGDQKVGKTSMHSVVFAKIHPVETEGFTPTRGHVDK